MESRKDVEKVKDALEIEGADLNYLYLYQVNKILATFS
jgi:hypothetical protein